MTFGRSAAEAVKTVIKIAKVSFFTIIRKKHAIKAIWKSIALPGLLGDYKGSNEIVGLTGVGGQAV